MKLELDLVEGICRGFNLVAEDTTEQQMLETIRDMCMFTNKKAERVKYCGATMDKEVNISRVIFMQSYIADMPDNHSTKRSLHKAILAKSAAIPVMQD